MHGVDPDLLALQEVRDKVAAAWAACESIHGWDQERTDRVCAAMAKAGAAAAHDLARLAVEETGIGRIHYKVLKNLFGSEGTWESIKSEKTVGVILRDERAGIVEIATPAGVVAGVVPTTNPTSTALNKALISVKGKNAIVISPHPRARRCIGETVEVLRRAIERAGGPPDLVSCLSHPTIESTNALMRHPQVSIILATGGAGLVKAAYSSGKPAYGVGPGNVPCYVDRSADAALAARWIVASQSFDNGTLCCSEQGLVLDRPIAERVLSELRRRGAHLCSAEEAEKLGRLCNRGGHMNPEVVGLDPWRVAWMAGFEVPRTTSVLLAHQAGVGAEHPLSIEILCPLLSVHLVDGWQEGCRVSKEILAYGGLGHTLGVWAREQSVLEAWFLEKPANRIVVNGPTSEGAVGYSTALVPAMSLGCGPQAGNITSDNISARHLINVKRAAWPRRDWPERYERDHARAAALSGERAPRGSGLPGDPAMEGASERGQRSALSPDAVSSWRGNPPVELPAGVGGAAPSGAAQRGASVGAGASPSVQAGAPAGGWPRPGGKSSPEAARFGGQETRNAGGQPAGGDLRPKVGPGPKSFPPPGASTLAAATGSVALAEPPKRPASAAAAPRGAPAESLPRAFFRDTTGQAGEGCPMGPCRGCPHNHPITGACLA